MTTIQDTVYNAGGVPANGQVVISSPPFTMNGVSVAASQITAPIVDGALSVQLYANMNAQPTGVYYTATYELDGGPVYDEYWVVPNQPTVNLGQVRVSFPATPSVMINAQQLTSAGALPGQFLGWSGGNWVPMYVTSFNYYPNFINFTLTGFAGADLSVTGSPVSLGAGLTMNVPDAGPTSRGVVNTGAQSFAGNKTFTGNVGVQGSLTGSGALFTTVLVTNNLQVAGTTNLVVNPTSQLGDLIVRAGPGITPALQAFPLGASGTVLFADNTQPLGLRWGVLPPSGGAGGGSLPPGSNTGDMLYWDEAAPTWTILPIGAPGNVLTAVGGGVGLNWLAPTGYWQGGPGGAIYYDGGPVGIGTPTPAAALDSDGMIRCTGLGAVPTTGSGVEIFWSGSAGQIDAYNRATSATLPLTIQASPLVMNASGGGLVGIGTAAPVFTLDVVTSAAVACRLSNTAAANNNVQLRFHGANANADLWALGADMAAGNGDKGFEFYDVLANKVPMYVAQNSGNVGIGTIAPLHTLDVVSASAVAATIASTGSAGAVGMGSYQGAAFIQAYADHTAAVPGPLCLQPSAGNVGIGTTNPDAPLHVMGTGCIANFYNTSGANNIYLQVVNNAGATLFGIENSAGATLVIGGLPYASVLNIQGNYALQFGTGNTVRMTITSTGGVGIGTATPAYALDVHGNGIINTGAPKASATIGAFYLASSDATDPVNAWLAAYGGSAPRLALGIVEQGIAWRNVTLCETAGSVGVGIASPSSTAIFQVSDRANHSLGISGPIVVPGAACINAVNDAFSANIPLEIRASATVVSAGNFNVGANGISWASGGFNVVGARSYFYANSEAFSIGLAYAPGSTVGVYIGSNSNNQFQVSASGGSGLLTIDQGGNVTMPAGTVNIGAGSAASPGDLAVGRNSAPATGAVYFGNTGAHYLYWDGGAFNFTGAVNATAGLTVNGNCNITGQYEVNGVPIATGGITVQNYYGSGGSNRVIGTTYQNTSGKAMHIAVSVQCNSGFGAQAMTDGANPPTTQVAVVSMGSPAGSSVGVQLFFIVLPNNFYRVTNANAVFQWTEWY